MRKIPGVWGQSPQFSPSWFQAIRRLVQLIHNRHAPRFHSHSGEQPFAARCMMRSVGLGAAIPGPVFGSGLLRYLPHFEAAIKEGGAYSVMCAYNRVDGDPACASPRLLGDILRQRWGFSGYVVSDCGAVGDIFCGHNVAPSMAAERPGQGRRGHRRQNRHRDMRGVAARQEHRRERCGAPECCPR